MQRPPAALIILASAMSSPVSIRMCSKPGVLARTLRRTSVNPPEPIAVSESAQATFAGSNARQKTRMNTVHAASTSTLGEWNSGTKREAVDVAPLAERYSTSQCVALDGHIGVAEQQILAMCRTACRVERVDLAEPSLGQRLDADDLEPWVTACGIARDVARAVGRAVVHEDELEIRVVLGEARAKRRPDSPRLVPRRHDDRDAGPARPTPSRETSTSRTFARRCRHATTQPASGDRGEDGENDAATNGASFSRNVSAARGARLSPSPTQAASR